MYNNSNELYHHGVMGMHWGIRRYQPYRKGDKVKGGKEVGKATKVEQRPIGERIKKAIASMNKIKKEIHKGSEEKAEYKFKMAQLKAAKKEVKKAQRREKEERIRERIREHREEQRMERQEAEERRERNWQRARDIANDAATIGSMLYGAYQLKKSMQGERGVGSPSGGSSPSVTTSGSSSGSRNRLTSYTPPGAHSPTTPSITRSGSGGSTSSAHSFSSNRAVRSEAARAQRNSITNSINSAVTKLKNKQNKTDADRYALISLAAFKNRVSSSSDDDAMKMVNLTPDELIQRYTHRDSRIADRETRYGGYAYHGYKSRHDDELYHHGILGMHWGIRRYQPYRKGERVKGGKEVGKATKVEQRQGYSGENRLLTTRASRFDSKHSRSINESVNYNDPDLNLKKLDDSSLRFGQKKRFRKNEEIKKANQEKYSQVIKPMVQKAGLTQDPKYPWMFSGKAKGTRIQIFADHEQTPVKDVIKAVNTVNKYVKNQSTYDKRFISAFKKEYAKDPQRWKDAYGLTLNGLKVGGVRGEKDGSIVFSLYPEHGGIIDGWMTPDGKIHKDFSYDD